MQLSLKITSYQRLTPGQDDVFHPASESFTIGRNSHNDWAIPDPQRFLSGSHCRIHYEDGKHYITDTSTNGVFLNDSETRLQRDEVVSLNQGDKFRIGDYVFEVLFDDPSLTGNPQTSEEDTSAGFEAFQQDNSFSDPDKALESDPFSEADPFAESEPFETPKQAGDDFQKDINTPLAQMDEGPLGRPVSINSLMDLDDDDDTADEPESADSLEQGRSPLNQAFEPSAHKLEPVATYQPTTNAGSDSDSIPDNWDEATGLYRIPQQDVESAATDSMDIPDDWDATTGIRKLPAKKPVPTAVPPAPSAPAPPAPITATAKRAPAGQPVQKPETTPTPTAIPATTGSSDSATAAFARGAGLELTKISGIEQSVLFEQVGRMLAMFTKGLIQTLGGRSEIKSEFRLEQTMIRPADNNPFKFSTSEAMTMLQLLSKSDPAYLSGAKAISEGFDDINAHQMAVVAGMEAALQNILARFNPKTLETRMASDSVLDRILPVGKKARHWDVFKLLFDEIAGEAEDDFQKLFGREFSLAYEEQLSRLKSK